MVLALCAVGLIVIGCQAETQQESDPALALVLSDGALIVWNGDETSPGTHQTADGACKVGIDPKESAGWHPAWRSDGAGVSCINEGGFLLQLKQATGAVTVGSVDVSCGSSPAWSQSSAFWACPTGSSSATIVRDGTHEVSAIPAVEFYWAPCADVLITRTLTGFATYSADGTLLARLPAVRQLSEVLVGGENCDMVYVDRSSAVKASLDGSKHLNVAVPDGIRLVAWPAESDVLVVNGSPPAGSAILDLGSTRQVLTTLSANETVVGVDNDGRTVALFNAETHELAALDLASGDRLPLDSDGLDPTIGFLTPAVRFSPDGSTLCWLDNTDSIVCYNLGTHTHVRVPVAGSEESSVNDELTYLAVLESTELHVLRLWPEPVEVFRRSDVASVRWKPSNPD
jgi:hypothetical protein